MLLVSRLPVLPRSFYNAPKVCRIILSSHGSELSVYHITNSLYIYRLFQYVGSWFHAATFGRYTMLDTKIQLVRHLFPYNTTYFAEGPIL